jgi:hypothetical protein
VDLLGRDAHAREITTRTAVKQEPRGSWNKWRGPAPCGEAAVYAAKARWLLLDREHAVIGWLGGNPAHLCPVSPHHLAARLFTASVLLDPVFVRA